MDLCASLHRSKGIARATVLHDLGFSRAEIDRAVQKGSITRPSNGWLALRDTDEELVDAARRSALLSCITQARRLGLWVFTEPKLHIASRTPVSRTDGTGCVVHWGKPIIPRVLWALEDSLENVLGYVADCQPREAALAIWESALNKQLITLDRLSVLPYRQRARSLLAQASPYSDSGLESFVNDRLRW